MVAYSFNRRFKDQILAGTKRHTIRGGRKRHARPGEEMQLYVGMPLARVFSPDNTVAHRLGEPQRVLLCQDCGIAGRQPIALLLEEEPARG